MKKYIALLRGINVGGKNQISMASLKISFEEIGFTEVTTYINSGNIIFSSEDCESILQKRIELLIADQFKLAIPVVIISAQAFSLILSNAPSWWDEDKNSKHNIIFVIPPATVEEALKQVGEAKPDYEQIFSYDMAIFWSAPIRTFSKTRWAKVSATSAYNSITIRNANTAKKLAKLIN